MESDALRTPSRWSNYEAPQLHGVTTHGGAGIEQHGSRLTLYVVTGQGVSHQNTAHAHDKDESQ
jgi:hypothetical protein